MSASLKTRSHFALNVCDFAWSKTREAKVKLGSQLTFVFPFQEHVKLLSTSCKSKRKVQTPIFVDIDGFPEKANAHVICEHTLRKRKRKE